MNRDFKLSQAESYEAYIVPAIFVQFTDALVATARPRSGNRVLDVGSGTGIVSRVVAPIVGPSGRMVGLDIDLGMLSVARSLEPADGADFEWGQGDVAKMPFENAEFDLVLSQAALQFFPHKLAALREIRRVLAPSGRLVVSVFRSIERNPAFEVLARALDRHVSPEVGGMRRAIFAFGEAEELLSLLVDAGFKDSRLSSVQEMVRFPSPEEFLRRQLASQSPWVVDELDTKRLQALVVEVGTELRKFVNEDGLSFPMEVHIVLAKK